MRIRALSLAATIGCLLLLTLGQVAAQGFDYESLQIEVTLGKKKIEPGKSGSFEIVIAVPVGYSLSGDETVLRIEPLPKLADIFFCKLERPEADYEDAVGPHYIGDVLFQLPFAVSKNAPPGQREITFGFQLQVCDETTGQCFFPTEPEDITRTIIVEIVSNESTLKKEYLQCE